MHFTWYMVGDDKISLEDLCLLRQNAVLPGKQLLVFWGSNLLQNVHNYLMTEITSCPRRNVSSSTPIWESPILKYHLFGNCVKITNIYTETITRILDTNLSFHCRTYYRSCLTEGCIVYSVCQSNTEDIGKIES